MAEDLEVFGFALTHAWGWSERRGVMRVRMIMGSGGGRRILGREFVRISGSNGVIGVMIIVVVIGVGVVVVLVGGR